VGETPDILASYLSISPDTPPVFLVHASDDNVATAANSAVMYLALMNAGVSAELHIYATGGHGLGVRRGEHPSSAWPERCAEWLRDQGILADPRRD
jgi:acetyl esterase/lipase